MSILRLFIQHYKFMTAKILTFNCMIQSLKYHDNQQSKHQLTFFIIMFRLKVFKPDTNYTPNIHKQILIGTFQYPIGFHTYSKIELRLTDTFLFAIEQTPNKLRTVHALGLDFDTSFELIYEDDASTPNSIKLSPNENDCKAKNHAVAIRFYRQNHNQAQFFPSEGVDLDIWQHELNKKINQRGFHRAFKATKKIGKGNFATVYLGQRVSDGRQVAIKSFAKQSIFTQERGKEALINEIKINRLWKHPNLMGLEAVYETDNSLYLILEYINGEPLENKLQTRYKFSQAEIRQIMRGIIQGISQMTRKNVIHRDLKPQNIIFKNDSKEAVIVDFGLSTLADQKQYLFVRCGTPGFVAPEIANISDMTQKSHPISDIFSAGCIFYNMLFNKSLFPGKNFNEVLLMNRQCDFNLNGPEFDSLPAQTTDLLRKMLQKQPQLRISAVEVLKHSYFAETHKKIYIPKIHHNQSSTCPTYLIDSSLTNFKMIVKQSTDHHVIAQISTCDTKAVEKNFIDKLIKVA